jgi:hypothetical protein
MSKIKLEHIDNLRRGKKSWAKIGSRWTPHHLYKYEEVQYQRALKNRYLEVTTKDRDNLINLREKVCMAQWWTNYLLIKIHWEDNASVLRENAEIKKGEIKEMKIYIKKMVTDENIR